MKKVLVSGSQRCWFAVDSMIFECLVEVVGSRLHGVILERSGGYSSWIRFGLSSLSFLLEGVESCCRQKVEEKFAKSWEENGRRFWLEKKTNGARNYILCSVLDLEAKKLCLVFPEGQGVKKGWFLLAEKLRVLGVTLSSEEKNPTLKGLEVGVEKKKGLKQGERGDFVKIEKKNEGRRGDALWMEIGGRGWNSREEQLNRCLVGNWEKGEEYYCNLDSLRRWGKQQWNLQGEISIKKLLAGTFLLEFESKEEATRVLKRGVRCFQNKMLMIEKWKPDLSCFRVGSRERKDGVWVRVAGLPLQFWNQRMFKRIGDCCGGFLDVDLDTENFTQLQWARILVKTEREDLPRSLQVVMGSSCFDIQLWWEVPACLSVVVPAKLKNRGSPECVRAGKMEKIGTAEGVSTNASETQSKVNNVSPWDCIGSEKGATDSTSLLDEASKSKSDDCAGKRGEDRGREELEVARGLMFLNLGWN